jgi:regulatory protein
LKERNLDKEVQGESSSSQNVKLSILKIIGRGARSGKAELLLSNGSSFFITQKLLSEYSLHAGTEISSLLALELEAESDFLLAKKKALELLASREHSVYQLKHKLVLREFCSGNIDRVLTELQEAGSLNNRRFMELWVDSRIRKHPEGYHLLLAGLLKAGIPLKEASAYLVSFLDEIDMDEVLERAGLKFMRRSTMNREKIIRCLKNRGFKISGIMRFIDKYYNK